jgi:hypothetical protein
VQYKETEYKKTAKHEEHKWKKVKVCAIGSITILDNNTAISRSYESWWYCIFYYIIIIFLKLCYTIWTFRQHQ